MICILGCQRALGIAKSGVIDEIIRNFYTFLHFSTLLNTWFWTCWKRLDNSLPLCCLTSSSKLTLFKFVLFYFTRSDFIIMLDQFIYSHFLFAYLVLGYTTNIIYQEYFDYDNNYQQTVVVVLWPGALMIITIFMLLDIANCIKTIIMRLKNK